MKIESGRYAIIGLSLLLLMSTTPYAAVAGTPAAAVTGEAVSRSLTRESSGRFPAGLSPDLVANTNVNDSRATVNEVLRWKEGNGDALAVFMTVDGGSEGNESRDLYVTTFRQTGSTLQRIRTIKELSGACEFDLAAEFVAGSVTLTNLDGDAQGELTFGYRTTCTSDVSPSAYKVFILEGGAKYGIRGTTRVNIGNDERVGGEAKEDFKGAPASFAGHVRRIWSAHVNE